MEVGFILLPSAFVMSLPHSLTHLESSGLIALAQAEPELEYLFRHVLIQDAAYASLLRADRRTLHRVVGETLERTYPDRLDELAPVLAEHFAAADDDDRAFKYFTLAGDAAARVYANAEAVTHYTRAIEIAKRATATPDSKLPTSNFQFPISTLYLHRGRALELLHEDEAALRNYEAMQAAARERGDRQMELAALTEQTKLRATPNPLYNPPLGRTLAEETIALARELGDRATEARLLWCAMILEVYSGGNLLLAGEYGQQSLALTRELNLREQMAFTLNDIWYPYMATDRLAQAQAALQEARDLWKELGNLPMLAESLSDLSHVFLWQGNFQRAIACSEEAYQLSQSARNLQGQLNSIFMIFIAHQEQGSYDKALSLLEEAVTLGERLSHLPALTGPRAYLGWVYGQLGAVERGLALVQQARALAEEKFPVLRPLSLALLARLHLRQGHLVAAEALLDTVDSYSEIKQHVGFIPHMWIGVGLAMGELALAKGEFHHVAALMDDLYAAMRAAGVRPMLADVLYLKSQALLASDQTEAAYVTLQEARAEAEALPSRPMLWRILRALRELEIGRGHTTEAEALREQARAVVAFITDHCPQSLRESFLNLPEVSAVMNQVNL